MDNIAFGFIVLITLALGAFVIAKNSIKRTNDKNKRLLVWVLTAISALTLLTPVLTSLHTKTFLGWLAFLHLLDIFVCAITAGIAWRIGGRSFIYTTLAIINLILSAASLYLAFGAFYTWAMKQ